MSAARNLAIGGVGPVTLSIKQIANTLIGIFFVCENGFLI